MFLVNCCEVRKQRRGEGKVRPLSLTKLRKIIDPGMAAVSHDYEGCHHNPHRMAWILGDGGCGMEECYVNMDGMENFG